MYIYTIWEHIYNQHAMYRIFCSTLRRKCEFFILRLIPVSVILEYSFRISLLGVRRIFETHSIYL